jgi:hypothetical protein
MLSEAFWNTSPARVAGARTTRSNARPARAKYTTATIAGTGSITSSTMARAVTAAASVITVIVPATTNW